MEKWIEKNWWRVLIVYVVIGLLTFGNSWNDSLNCGPEPNILEDRAAWTRHWECEHPMALMRGVFWPIFFVGEIAIWITK